MTNLKDQAMKTATKVLGSAPAAGLLSHPKLQDVVRRVINLRSDVRDALDERVATLARRFDLVTQKELKHYKRMVRELENQLASLEHELAQQRRRAERAEGDLGAAKKEVAKAKAEAASKAEAAKAEPAADAKPPAADKAPTKKAAKRTSPAKKASATASDAAEKKPARKRAPSKKAKKAAAKE